MSWLERAISWRRMLAGDDAGVRFVHRWIALVWSDATVRWAARVYCALDDAMERGGHDGASGWGYFRNDVTTWLAGRVTPDEREYLVGVATCIERYLRALGTTHASASGPIAARWREALERGDDAALAAVVDDARSTPEMHTAGAGGVLSLIEASAGMPLTTPIRVGPSERSGVPLAAPITVCVLSRTGGERELRFASVEEIVIGRADDAAIHLPNDLVARKHARIVREGDSLVVEDLRSDNGTWLFERRLGRAALEVDDVLLVGEDLLRFD